MSFLQYLFDEEMFKVVCLMNDDRYGERHPFFSSATCFFWLKFLMKDEER